MGARRKKAARNNSSTPAWMWLLTGVLIGLGLAYFLYSKGMLPQAEPAVEDATTSILSSEEVAPAGENTKPEKNSRYDFFTVLPEMEVVVPEQELQKQREPETRTTPSDDSEQYMLQAGSFRDGGDAEELKARLALMGMSTQVQTVTVNGATWHRVLVGPVSGAQRADELRQQLAAQNIDSMVTRSQN